RWFLLQGQVRHRRQV
ncbi:hypothetical protein BN1723_019677, partial [Verticillium longisporum]